MASKTLCFLNTLIYASVLGFTWINSAFSSLAISGSEAANKSDIYVSRNQGQSPKKSKKNRVQSNEVEVVDCDWVVNIINPVGRTNEFSAEVACPIGVIRELVITIYEGNVGNDSVYIADPDQNSASVNLSGYSRLTPAGFGEKGCGSHPTCSHRVEWDILRTAIVKAVVTIRVTGIDELPYTIVGHHKVAFNDNGNPYPVVEVYDRYGPGLTAVPFPLPDFFPNNSSELGTPALRRQFREDLIDFYTVNGWTIPVSVDGGSIEAHHVKPLSFGGDNEMSNGVLLPNQLHQRFTAWWGGPTNGPFSIRSW